MRPAILVFGGSGLLGLNMAFELDKDYEIILGFNRRKLNVPSVKTVNVSSFSPEKICSIISKLKVSAVLNSAGMTNVEECEKYPELAYQANTELARNIALAASHSGVKLIHVSTDHLFSGEESYTVESAPKMPLNTYARTKSMGEEEVMRICPHALIVRTNFYGFGPKYRPSFSDHILNALTERTRITLFDDVFYSPLLMTELIRVINDLVRSDAYGIFNVAGLERLTKYDFGVRLANCFGLQRDLISRGSITECHNLVRRPRDMSLCCHKVQQALGYAVMDITQQLERLKAQSIVRRNFFSRL